jgi:hypothetical protein
VLVGRPSCSLEAAESVSLVMKSSRLQGLRILLIGMFGVPQRFACKNLLDHFVVKQLADNQKDGKIKIFYFVLFILYCFKYNL